MLLLVTVVCSLLLATRLLWCYMYLFSGTATNVNVEPHSGVNQRGDAAAVRETLRIKESEIAVRGLGRKTYATDDEENSEDDELEPGLDLIKEKVADENKDVNKGRLVDNVDGEKIAEVEEIWNDEKKISEEMAKIADNDAKIGDENVMEGEENDLAEETTARGEDENQVDETTAGNRKLPDAVAYLERLAGDLAKAGE